MNGPCFRLRFGKRELYLVPGAYFIGRSASCHLRIDDSLVSRRHAELVVASADRASIRDCGSANGVFVNGVRLPPHEPEPLEPGSRVVVGKEVIEVHAPSIAPPHRAVMDTQREESEVPNSQDGAETTAVTPLSELADADAMSGWNPRGWRDRPVDAPHTAVTARTDALQTYAPVARSALAMGRSEDAETLMGAHLQAVLSRLKAGQDVPPETVNRTAEMAVELARAGRPGWFDFVVNLYDARRAVPPAHVISGLERALELEPEVDPLGLSRWVQSLRSSIDGLGVDDLPSIDRLEIMLGAVIRGRRQQR